MIQVDINTSSYVFFGFHNQGLTLSVNPFNCWSNYKWFSVLFLKIQLMFM